MSCSILCSFGDVQSLSNIALDVVNRTADAYGLVVVVPGNVDDTFPSRFLDKYTLFVSVRVLPRVFDDEWRLGVVFAMLSSKLLPDRQCTVLVL